METNQTYSKTNFKFFNKKIIIAIIFIITAVWSFPELLWQTMPYRDDSIAMHMVKIQGFVFGEDIIFVHGPLAYLIKPFYITTPLWISSVAFLAISHVLTFATFGLFCIKREIALKHVIPISIMLIFWSTIPNSPYVYLAALALSFFLYLSSTKKLSFLIKLPFLITLSFSCSFLFFIKFDLAIASLGLLLVFSLFLLLKKRWQELSIGILTYLGFVILLSNFALESPSNLIPYLSTSLETVSGYSAAMSIDRFESFTTPIAIASISLLIFTLIIKKFRVDKPELFFLFTFLFFLVFKHGTVRNDGHVMDFFFGGALILYIYYSSFFNSKGKFLHLKIFAYFLVPVMVFAGFYAADFKSFDRGTAEDRIENFIKIIEKRTFKIQATSFPTMNLLLSDDTFAESYISQGKEKIKKVHPLSSSTEELLKDKTVDIFPWEIGVIYAYDFNWNPRPVIQSFNVWTSELDHFNAQHLQDMSSAPEFILFNAKGLDGRFPYFDEPATLRELLCSYKTVKIDGPFMIMEKKTNSCSEPKILKTQKIKFNEIVTVPSYDSDFLFVKVKLEQNVLGEILDKFYKPPQIRMTINDENKSYRFIAQPASNGILLSLSDKEIENFPTINYDIASFRLTTDTRFYYDDIELEFFEIDG